jgi:hypothetical protein
MSSLAWFLVTVSVMTPAAAPRTESTYVGHLKPDQPAATRPERGFTLSVLTLPSDDAPRWGFQLEDRGMQGLAWPERFGIYAGSAAATAPTRRPALVHRVDDNPFVVPVPFPWFAEHARLATDAEWTDGLTSYRCAEASRVLSRDCWIVQVMLDRGRRQQLAVEKDTGVIVRLEERLFLGRGDAFTLTYELTEQRALEPDEFVQTEQVIQALTALQAQLERPDLPTSAELTATQLAAAAESVSAIGTTASTTRWQRLVDVILRDVQQQLRRIDGLSGLVQRFVGQPAELPNFRLLNRETLKAADLTQRVVVLHLWDYNGEHLEEPYGQVGYLDFLNARRQKLGVDIIGVAVDTRFADPAQFAAAARPVRKLQEFMNLGYKLAVDDGGLVKQWGDPPALGGRLPLWLVVGHDGVILHYQPGLYALKPDEGLKELDAAIIAALKRQRGATADGPTP